jgi:hypothetical protein
VVELNDKLFLALAKKAGFPSREVVKRCKALKGERSLFTAVCDEGELTPEQQKKFERWAKQVKRGDLSPLEGVSVSSVESTPSGAKIQSECHHGSPSARLASLREKTPSAGKVKTPSAAKIRTPSAAKITAGAAAKKRRRLRQSSRELPVATETFESGSTSKDETTHDAVGTPDAPAVPAKIPPARRPGLSTPSTSRGATADLPTRAPGSRVLLIIAGAALVASACVGVGIFVATSKTPTETKVAEVEKPKPQADDPKPVPVVVRGPSVVRPSAGSTGDDKVARALKTAEQLARENREDEAVMTLDAVLDVASGESQKTVIEAKNRLVSRLRDQIDRVKSLAAAGKPDEARKLLASLRGHFPESLNGDLDEAERFIAAKATASSSGPDATSGTTASDAPKPAADAPTAAGDAAKPPAPAKPAVPLDPKLRRAWELDQIAKVRAAVTKALLELDLATAKAALDASGPFAEKDTIAGNAIDRKRLDSAVKILAFAGAGLRTTQGTNVELALRDGTRISGRLSKVDGRKAVVATPAGDVPVPFENLATEPLLRVALLGASDDLETYFFGRGVLLACAGDKKGALEALELAPSIAEAAALKTALEANDPTFAPPPKAQPSAGGAAATTTERKKKEEPGTAVVDLDEPKPHAKTWMDDTDGGVDWDQAYVVQTKHYVIRTNVKKEYVPRYEKILEGIAARYEKIFEFSGNDFKYNKNEVLLYRSQEEFMSHEQMPPNIGGFYNPGDKKLHIFHGPWKGADDTTTLNVIAHEAVHQFQNLVLREMNHAPTFVIEGFSTWAEGTIITKDGDVIVGPISAMRLRDMRRAFKAGEYIHLSELVRTPHAGFSGFHYAHTWGLFHWFFFGPESGFKNDYKPAGKSMQLMLAYWNLCLQKPTTGKDFEDLLKQIFGWNMDQLEKAWKDWILSLDLDKDPMVEKYEKLTKKKVVTAN